MSKFFKIAILFVFAGFPAMAHADIYRYQTNSGEVILTTQPRKDLKLLDVIKTSTRNSAPKAHKTQAQPAVASASSPASDKTVLKVRKNDPNDPSHRYDAYIAEASKLYGIPFAFIKAVIKIESNFNPKAVSRVGAMGLMQLMPGTASHMNVSDPFDPHQNILGGTKYLRRLSDRYDGDINLILSGYNAGPGNVAKAGGIPFADTQKYVRNVYDWYVRYRNEE